MIDQPLNSADQSKILIFTLLMLPFTFFGAAILPALFLCIGVFMMKKHEDFSYIRTAVKICNWYGILPALGFTTIGIITALKFSPSGYDKSFYSSDAFMISLIGLTISIIYIFFLNTLFLKPLVSHWKWIELNGIFSSKPKNKNIVKDSEIDIIKSESLRSYSVADELIKWAKLKEDGYISEEEFQHARDKLLQRK
jgi:hypothetical protein